MSIPHNSLTWFGGILVCLKVEWDMYPSFNSLGTKPLSYDSTLKTSPEVEDIDSDGSGR